MKKISDYEYFGIIFSFLLPLFMISIGHNNLSTGNVFFVLTVSTFVLFFSYNVQRLEYNKGEFRVKRLFDKKWTTFTINDIETIEVENGSKPPRGSIYLSNQKRVSFNLPRPLRWKNDLEASFREYVNKL